MMKPIAFVLSLLAMAVFASPAPASASGQTNIIVRNGTNAAVWVTAYTEKRLGSGSGGLFIEHRIVQAWCSPAGAGHSRMLGAHITKVKFEVTKAQNCSHPVAYTKEIDFNPRDNQAAFSVHQDGIHYSITHP
jgi:hypothetical protein